MDDQQGISDKLPKDVMRNILMYLPLKQAARTSVLSTKWRHIWVTLPQLVFDKEFHNDIKGSQLASKDKILPFICEVLWLHRAPVLKFNLSIPGVQSCREIDNIVQFLSRNGVEELTLQITGGGTRKHKLPSHFFSSQQLKRLSLSNCEVRCPSSFRGFRNLIELHVSDVIFYGWTIASFISSCPLLEDIQIVDRDRTIKSLRICAPNLRNLYFTGLLNSISLKHLPKLLELHIFADGPIRTWEKIVPWKTSQVEEFFNCLGSLQCLKLDDVYMKCLTAENILTRPRTTLRNLKYLSLSGIWFMETYQIAFPLWLITNSPNLKSLEIQLNNWEGGDGGPTFKLLEVQDYSSVSLDHLYEVHIECLSGWQTEVEFIRVLLDKSPCLKIFDISTFEGMDAEEEVEVLSELLALPRASTTAVIKYKRGK